MALPFFVTGAVHHGTSTALFTLISSPRGAIKSKTQNFKIFFARLLSIVIKYSISIVRIKIFHTTYKENPHDPYKENPHTYKNFYIYL